MRTQTGSFSISDWILLETFSQHSLSAGTKTVICPVLYSTPSPSAKSYKGLEDTLHEMFARGEHCDGPWHYLDTVLAIGIGAALTPSDQELDPSGSQNQLSQLNMRQPLGARGRNSLGSFYCSFQGSAVRLPSHIARAMPTSPRTIHLNIYFNK